MSSRIETVYLDGESLTPETLVELSTGQLAIDLSEAAWAKVRAAREMIERILESGEVVYGINTGFGSFASTTIAPHKLKELQENLIRSHSAGVGNPLSRARTRMLLALRVNVLAKGHSGISCDTLKRVIGAFVGGAGAAIGHLQRAPPDCSRLQQGLPVRRARQGHRGRLRRPRAPGPPGAGSHG